MAKFLILDQAKNILEFDVEENRYETIDKIINNNLNNVKHHATRKDLNKSISEFLKK